MDTFPLPLYRGILAENEAKPEKKNKKKNQKVVEIKDRFLVIWLELNSIRIILNSCSFQIFVIINFI